MVGYKALHISGNTTGLVQKREDFLLPVDAYPVLENAFVWRERIKRKQGTQLLGRLRRVLVNQVFLDKTEAATQTIQYDPFDQLGIAGEADQIQPGTFILTTTISDVGTLTDVDGVGTLVGTGAFAPTGSTINYGNGTFVAVYVNPPAGGGTMTVSFNYYPGLPVMGLRPRDRPGINNEQLIAFDTKYAYAYTAGSGFHEFIPGMTWTGEDYNFFWSTNYWVNASNQKLFWVTNFSGTSGDPIRYTDGISWIDFAPIIDSANNVMAQALILLPFRGRLLALHTLEGPNLAGAIEQYQRIRWAAIGNPLTATAWRDDIRGQGGFLDIPTSEQIVAAGFVRDNLVIYCEHSTWQLRYTGQSIAPFQIEKVNTELGAESTFSAIQFDTSLVGVGDKGIIECDSFKSERIDTKIIDLVFDFNNLNHGQARVHGIRDFEQRLAYWCYPDNVGNPIYPNRRLVYNYENQSWAIHTDSFTCFGTFQYQTPRTWAGTPYPWETQNYSWVDRPALFPDPIAGNQVGYVQLLDEQTTNDVSLTITAITGNTTTPTVITVPNHNLVNGSVISISGIPTGTHFDNLNKTEDPTTHMITGVFGVGVIDLNTLELFTYNSGNDTFDTPQLNAPGTYVGGGMVAVRDNFRILSKKFNSLDEGQKLQIGYLDILTNTTPLGAFSLRVYNDYNENPGNVIPLNESGDTFFNATIPTSTSALAVQDTMKSWQRVYCPTRANTVQIEFRLSNGQMNGIEQESDVQIDAQVLWARSAGRLTI